MTHFFLADHWHSLLVSLMYLDFYLVNCHYAGCGENWLAAGESNQSVCKDVNSERVVGWHVDVDPQVKLITADEVGLVEIPVKYNHNNNVSTQWVSNWCQVSSQWSVLLISFCHFRISALILQLKTYCSISSDLLTFGPVVVSCGASGSICGWPGYLLLWLRRAVGHERRKRMNKDKYHDYTQDLLCGLLE